MRLHMPPIRQFFPPNHLTGMCLLTFSLLLAACGGGGGGGGNSSTGTPAAAVGTVEKIGSVKVNGITFDCRNATVTFDDGVVDAGDDRCVQANRAGELEDDMRVIVKGRISDDGITGSADSVIVRTRYTGPVASIDKITPSFEILGQTVLVDDATVFKINTQPKALGSAGLDLLTDDDIVKVHGIPNESGVLVAIFVKTKAAPTGVFEVKGIVTAATPIDFQIGTLTVVLNGHAAPVVGACVEVKGTLSSPATLTLKSSADGLKLDDDCDGDSLPSGIAKAEIEGIINGFVNTATLFNVGGQPVSVSPSTTYRPAGATADNLRDGLKVEAEGSVSGGVLLASKIKIKENGVRIEALADSAGTATAFSILGIDVTTNASTRFDGGISSADDITTGMALRVRGFKSGESQVTASRVERRSGGSGDVELRGPLDADATASGFAILGVPVTITDTTEFDDSSLISFFAGAKANTIVKAKGAEIPNNAIVAEEVELED